jgi:hypothetical protein
MSRIPSPQPLSPRGPTRSRTEAWGEGAPVTAQSGFIAGWTPAQPNHLRRSALPSPHAGLN